MELPEKNNKVPEEKEIIFKDGANMVNLIKSNYIKKKIFSLLIPKKKLSIIKYNKYVQEQLGINKNYFNKVIGKYIKFDKNNDMEEYLLGVGILLYSGEHINGKRNGKGKEYNNNGNLIYEGEFKNGKRDGKGQEYNNKGDLIFKGEYSNGEKWNGIEKEFSSFNTEVYETEYLNGKIWNRKLNSNFYSDFSDPFETEIIYGYGKMKKFKINNYSKTSLLEVEYIEGEPEKFKEYLNEDILLFEGEYVDKKKWNGKGRSIKGDKMCELKNGNGQVIEFNDYNDLIFEGDYKNGKRTGKGKEYDINGNLIFEGDYKDGKRNGKGKEYNNRGDLMYEGEYLNGEKHGEGKEYDCNGELIFEGEYVNGEIWIGRGKEFNFFDGSLEYEGKYLYGERLEG